ncbi:MAG TPA: exodeoxyribonuclease VII large subunit [Blastocatellia bacterium]|nr:exodeoxyribonuclease VII large subunit [Blastocatellia bacterium]
MSQMTFLEKLMQQPQAMSVSELTARIKILVEGHFMDVMVEGEVSNFRRHSSGHWYFTLKDEGAMLRCASFRMQNRLIRFTPEDGLSVRAHGRLSLYEARGEYQLLVEFLEPVGIGALQLAFEQLKNRLAAEGLFDVERKRGLPAMPGSIGVVTSPTGAAVRDILRIIKRRNETVRIIIAPARVQGDGAAEEIAEAIGLLNSRDEVEVIIVGRGGGSIEDLWCFNDECVARAIFNSRAPVISAVGHETDFTIADFVADLRASTPSAAAEMVAMAADEASEHIARLESDMVDSLRYRLLEMRGRLRELESSRCFDEVANRIHILSQRADSAAYSIDSSIKATIKQGRAAHERVALRLRDADIRRQLIAERGALSLLRARLETSAQARIDRENERFLIAAGKLDSLSPLAVLGRGYAVAFDSRGGIIKRAKDVSNAERIRIRVGEGEIDCTVD